jgi:Tfp pilus assembly protein PilX
MNTARRFASPRRQSGSAYVIALLALVVLTILGLALALVTQSELQLGGNERSITRTFYASDSGIAASVSRALVAADFTGKTYRVSDPAKTGGLAIYNNVEVTPFYPLYDAPCNLCEVNNAGTYSNKAYRKLNNAVTTEAKRQGLAPGGTQIADKVIAVMIEAQPQPASVAAYRPYNDPAQLAKIKF